MDEKDQPMWVRHGLEQIKSSPFYDPETGKLDMEAARAAHAAREKRPAAHEPEVMEAIEQLRETEAGSPEQLAAMKHLGDVMGGAPDPDGDLFGWLSAVQPPPLRLGRIFYMDYIRRQNELDS